MMSKFPKYFLKGSKSCVWLIKRAWAACGLNDQEIKKKKEGLKTRRGA